MERHILRPILPTIFLIILGILIVHSSLIAIQKQVQEELALKKIQFEQKLEKASKDKAKLKSFLMGMFEPSQNKDFVLVPSELTTNLYKMYLREETLSAFQEMQAYALTEGINLKIASATRNFDYQKSIWNNKWNGYMLVDGNDLSKSVPNELERFKKILEYSAAPGTSRHHWGNDIDINNANAEYFEGTLGAKEYEWLTLNARAFGFCQPYNLKGNNRATGYNEEKWHWSYLPLAKTFTEQYKKIITSSDVKGFMGEEGVKNLNLINNYVLGINSDCL